MTLNGGLPFFGGPEIFILLHALPKGASTGVAARSEKTAVRLLLMGGLGV